MPPNGFEAAEKHVTFEALSVVDYLRGLDPRLPRSVWLVELGGVVNAFGNGFVYPFLFIYLHNLRGFALGVSGLIVATNAGVALLAGTSGGAAADRFGPKRTLAASLAILALAFALFLVDAASYAVFLALLALVPGGRGARVPVGGSGGYASVLRNRVFLALLGLNVVFVTAGYAQLETLPVFAKDQAHVGERAIGLVFLVNSVVIVLAQLPVTRLVEGRRRMVTLALMTVLWAAAWLLVFGAGLWLSALAAGAVIVVAGGIFAIGECLQGPTQQALIAQLAPDHLRGRYMALSTNSWSIGWIVGPALGAYVLQKEPLALWPAAAALCLGAGAAGLMLERRLPESVRLTPAAEIAPPSPEPADAPTPEGVEAEILG